MLWGQKSNVGQEWVQCGRLRARSWLRCRNWSAASSLILVKMVRLCHGFSSTHGAVLKGPAVSGTVTNFGHWQVPWYSRCWWVFPLGRNDLAAETYFHNYIIFSDPGESLMCKWNSDVLKWPWIILKIACLGCLPSFWFVITMIYCLGLSQMPYSSCF